MISGAVGCAVTDNATRGAVDKTLWSVADQGIYSGTSLAVSLVMAHSVDAREFGAFAVVYAVVIIALGVNRGSVCEPYAVSRRISVFIPNSSNQTAQATGASTAIALAFTTPLLILSIFVKDDAVRQCLLGFSLILPLLLIQDTYRFMLIIDGRPQLAVLVNAVCATSQVVLLAAALLLRVTSPILLILSWGLASSLSIGAAFWLLRDAPSLRRGVVWLSGQRRLSASYSLDFLMVTGVWQLILWLVAAIAGLPAAGGLRAVQMLFGPLASLAGGVRTAALSEGVRMREKKSRLLLLMLAVSVCLALVSMVWGIALIVMPANVGIKIVGETWLLAAAVAPWITLERVATGCTLGAVVGLRVLGDSRRTVETRFVSSLLAIFLGSFGAMTLGAVGAAAGIAVASTVNGCLWWRGFLKVRVERGYQLPASGKP